MQIMTRIKLTFPAITDHWKNFSRLCIFFSLFFSASCSENPEVIFERLMKEGDAAFTRGEYAVALSAWLNAENIHYDNAELYGKLGKAYLRLADYDLAKLSFKEVLKLEPKAWRSRLELAKMELITQDHVSAKENWEILKAQSNAPEIHVFHGDLLLFAHNYHEAEKAYRKALDLNKGYVVALIRLAVCYLFQEKEEEAEKIYLSLEEQNFENPELLVQIGNFWKIKGDDSLAELCLKKATEQSPEDLTYQRELAEYYYLAGRYQDAYSVLWSMRSKLPENRYVNKFLVDTLLLQNRLEEVNELFSSLPQGALGDLDWNLLKGKYYLLSGEQFYAISHFTSVLEDEPNFPAVHYFLALAYLAGGQSNLAQQNAVKALALDPEYVEVELLLADIYYKKKEYDLSLKHARRITEKVPENYRAHLIIGNVYLDLKMYKKALRKFATVRKLNPKLISPVYAMALTFELSGETEKASESYQQMLERDPEVLDVATRYALLLLKEKKNEKVKQFFQSLIKKNPDNGGLYQILGDIYWNSDELENSEKFFKKVIELQPTMTSGYLRLKEVYERTNNKAGLIHALQECISHNPTFPYGYIELAKFYESDGNIQLAQQVLEDAVKSNSDSPYLASSLAWFYLEQETNIDDAYLLAQIAYEKIPEDPAIADTLGWAYYKKDSLTRALWILNEALTLAPDNPLILFHLGVVHAARQDVSDAKQYLRQALKKGLSERKNIQTALFLLKDLQKKDFK